MNSTSPLVSAIASIYHMFKNMGLALSVRFLLLQELEQNLTKLTTLQLRVGQTTEHTDMIYHRPNASSSHLNLPTALELENE
jgi:hypothetical protein